MLRALILLLIFGLCRCTDKLVVPSGTSLTLPCLDEDTDEGLSQVFTWWFGHAQHLDPLNISESALSLGHVKAAHSGTYECLADITTATGRRKLKRTFEVDVKEYAPPMTWSVFQEPEEKPAMLPCHPGGAPPPQSPGPVRIRWFKQVGTSYKEIKLSGKAPSRFHWAPEPDKFTWYLYITHLKAQDEGMYKCEVTTPSTSTASFIIELIVEKIPPPRCFNQSHAWEACPVDEQSSAQMVMRESLTAFSVHLYRTLSTIQPSSSNLLFSPLSIAGVLSHLLLGSREETRADLEKALSLPLRFSCTHSAMRRLKDETKDSILIANQMFYNPALNISQAFINQSREFYEAVPERLTNGSAANVKLVNDWVASKTRSRITELVDWVDDAGLVLVDAVYFIGKWQGRFEENTGAFSTLSGDVVIAPSLYSSNFHLTVNYLPQLKATVARFPLEGRSSLYILVPSVQGAEALAQVERRLTESSVVAMVTEMEGATPTWSEVTLPKVKLLLDVDLGGLLGRMGLSQLFSDPNLCGMFQQQEGAVPLTDARHRCFLSLSGRGVEAAAASSVSFSRSLSTFSAMQPFVFLLWSERARAPVFMGRVLHPQEGH